MKTIEIPMVKMTTESEASDYYSVGTTSEAKSTHSDITESEVKVSKALLFEIEKREVNGLDTRELVYDPVDLYRRRQPTKLNVGSIAKTKLNKAYDFAFKRLTALRRCKNEMRKLESKADKSKVSQRVPTLNPPHHLGRDDP